MREEGREIKRTTSNEKAIKGHSCIINYLNHLINWTIQLKCSRVKLCLLVSWILLSSLRFGPVWTGVDLGAHRRWSTQQEMNSGTYRKRLIRSLQLQTIRGHNETSYITYRSSYRTGTESVHLLLIFTSADWCPGEGLSPALGRGWVPPCRGWIPPLQSVCSSKANDSHLFRTC